MIGWSTAFAADPVAQRSVTPSALVVGLETTSVSVRLGSSSPWSLGGMVRTDGGVVGLSLGARHRTGALTVGASGSVLGLPVAQGVGLGLAPWAAVGTSGDVGGLSLSLAVPMAAGTGSGAGFRLPAVLGGEGQVRVWRSWVVGVVGTAGVAWVPGLDTSFVGDLGLVIGTHGRRSGERAQ